VDHEVPGLFRAPSLPFDDAGPDRIPVSTGRWPPVGAAHEPVHDCDSSHTRHGLACSVPASSGRIRHFQSI